MRQTLQTDVIPLKNRVYVYSLNWFTRPVEKVNERYHLIDLVVNQDEERVMEFNLTWFEVKLYLGVLDHLESVKLVSALHVDLLLLDHPSEVSLEQVFLCHIFLLHKALFLLLEDIKG